MNKPIRPKSELVDNDKLDRELREIIRDSDSDVDLLVLKLTSFIVRRDATVFNEALQRMQADAQITKPTRGKPIQ